MVKGLTSGCERAGPCTGPQAPVPHCWLALHKIPETGSRKCLCQDPPLPAAQPPGEQQETAAPTQPAPGPTGLNNHPMSRCLLHSDRTAEDSTAQRH